MSPQRHDRGIPAPCWARKHVNKVDEHIIIIQTQCATLGGAGEWSGEARAGEDSGAARQVCVAQGDAKQTEEHPGSIIQIPPCGLHFV